MRIQEFGLFQQFPYGTYHRIETLTDGSAIPLDATLADVFTVSSVNNPTITISGTVPSGYTKKIIILFRAQGADRTLAIDTGNFLYSADVPAFSATTNGKCDKIGIIWFPTSSRWELVAYSKGA